MLRVLLRQSAQHAFRTRICASTSPCSSPISCPSSRSPCRYSAAGFSSQVWLTACPIHSSNDGSRRNSKPRSLRLYKDPFASLPPTFSSHTTPPNQKFSHTRVWRPLFFKTFKSPLYGAMALLITKRPQTMERSPSGNHRKQVHDTSMEMNSVCELFFLERFGTMELFLWELEKAMGTAAWCRERICKNRMA
jgi:hypothetical protein